MIIQMTFFYNFMLKRKWDNMGLTTDLNLIARVIPAKGSIFADDDGFLDNPEEEPVKNDPL
jgi:hypothetical protein